MMAVDVRASGSTFEAGTPRELFDHGGQGAAHSGNYFNYAVSADGQRFLIPRPSSNVADQGAPAPIAVVLNWDAALKK